MKSFYSSSVILLVALLFGSCTIEKRLHQPGWHVEWRKQLPVSDRGTAEVNHASRDEHAPVIRPDEELIAMEETIAIPQTSVTETQPSSYAKVLPQDAAVLPAITVYSGTEPADDTVKRKVIVIDENELPERRASASDTGVRDPLTVALWTLCILSLVAIAVCLILLLTSTGELFIAGFLVAEMAFLLLARAVLAALIRRRKRKYPDLYRDSNNVVLAVLLPELVILFALAMILVLAILAY